MKTNHRVLALPILLLQIASQPLFGSEQAPDVKDILRNIGQDQKAIVTSPLRMDTSDRWVWGVTGASMLLLMPEWNGHKSFDEQINAGIDRGDQPYESLFDRVTYSGDGGVLFGASAVTYGISSIGDYEGAQRFSAHWFEALVDTSLWVTAIKILAGRNRPQSKESESEFSGPEGYFSLPGENSSFPSGHTALAFATAAVFTRESDNNPWVGVPAYIAAGGVGFSRMYVEQHWLSDVLFGAVLGHSIGMLVENRRHRSQETAWHLEPVMDPERPGFALVYKW